MKDFVIFYLSHDNPLKSPQRKAIVMHPSYRTMFVRAEIVHAVDVDAAMEMAAPQRGETLMNAHPMVLAR